MARSVHWMNAALVALVFATATFFAGFVLGQHSNRQSLQRESQRATDAEELSVDAKRLLEAEIEKRVQVEEALRTANENSVLYRKKVEATNASIAAAFATLKDVNAQLVDEYARPMKLALLRLDAIGAQFFGYWQPVTNWSFIKKGMTRYQVRVVLGEPTEIVVEGLKEVTWQYYTPDTVKPYVTNAVDFIDGTVDSWQMGRYRSSKSQPSMMSEAGLIDDTDPGFRRRMLDLKRASTQPAVGGSATSTTAEKLENLIPEPDGKR